MQWYEATLMQFLSWPKQGLDSLKQARAPETIKAQKQPPDLPDKNRERVENNEAKLRSRSLGAAIVVANQYCDFKKELASPQHDLNLMVGLLSSLDFAIAHKNMDRLETKLNVREMINDISLLKLEDCCCFLFYYSGHADENGILTPDGHIIPYAHIIQKAGECESLSGKPKIFIFDCSRASLKNEAVTKDKELTKSSLPSDSLVIFSTSCGGHAFGERTSGSFFTREFEKAVLHFCRGQQGPRDLQGVLEEVSQGVREYVPLRSKGRYRQEAVVVSTLEKPILLPDLGRWSGVVFEYLLHCLKAISSQNIYKGKQFLNYCN